MNPLFKQFNERLDLEAIARSARQGEAREKPVPSAKRFKRAHPCPICGGYDEARRKSGDRCHGFISADDQVALCTREEKAGDLEPTGINQDLYPHALTGPCPCRTAHEPKPIDRSAGRAIGAVDAVYPYHDESGDLLYEEVRYRDPKGFKIRRPDPNGPDDSRIWDINGTRRILYRLHDLNKKGPFERVFIVEGPKDVDTLWDTPPHLPAVTNPFGAGKWTDDYADQLLKAGVTDVVILRDEDTAGREHQQVVAASCHRAGLMVRCVSLPDIDSEDLESGQDITDWLDDLHTVDELQEVVDETPTWTPPETRMLFGAEVQSLGSILVREIPPVDWETTGLVPKGQRVMVYGEWGSHKSWLLLSWALHLTRPGHWLHEAFTIPDARRVLYLDKEMSATSAMRRVQRLCKGMGVTPGDELPFSIVSGPQFTMDKDGGKRLLDVIDAKGRHAADVLFLETFRRVLKGSENDQEDVSAFWDSVTPLQKAGKTLFVSHHMRKPKGGRSRSRDAASGSTDILAGADGVFSLELEDKDLHLISVEHHKNRDSQEHPGFELRFLFTGDPDTGPVVASFIGATDAQTKASRLSSAHRTLEQAMLQAAKAAGAKGQPITTEYLRDATEALKPSKRLREAAITSLVRGGHLNRMSRGIFTLCSESRAVS
jgi:hypothetical protein